jgi:PAS domain S-box-containing protein
MTRVVAYAVSKRLLGQIETVLAEFENRPVCVPVAGPEDLRALLLEQPYCDVIIGDVTGSAVDEILRALCPGVPRLAVVPDPAVDEAVTMMRAGALDYRGVKDVDDAWLRHSIRDALAVRVRQRSYRNQVTRLVRDMVQGERDVSQSSPRPQQLSVRDLVVDESTLTVFFRDQVLELSPSEYEILRQLARAGGQVVPFEELSRHVQGANVGRAQARRMLSAHLSNLRAKLRDAGCESYLVNRRGVGYFLDTSVDAAARRTEAQFQLIAAHTSDIIGWMDENARIQYLTPSVQDVLGYSAESLIGSAPDNLLRRVHPDDLATLRERWASPSAIPRKTTFRAKASDGHYVWLESTANLFNISNGELSGVVFVLRDVTEQMEYGARVGSSEAQYRTLADGLPDLIARFDNQLRHLYVNPAVVQTVGIPAEKLIGHTSAELELPPDLVAVWTRALRHVFDTGEPYRVSYSYRTPRGRRFDYDSYVVPETVADGRVITALSVTRDITDVKRTEEALRESEMRYRIISESISNYAYALRVNPEGGTYLDWVTDAFEDITGHDPALLGEVTTWSKYIHPDDLPRVRHVLRAALNQGKPGEVDFRLYDSEGELRHMRDTYRPVVDPGTGRVVSMYGVGQDITARKLADARTFQLAMERERVKMLAEFIQAASHEFRTPLAVIRSSLYLLRRSDDPDRYTYHEQKIIDQTEHIIQLIEDLTVMARLDSGADLKLRPINLNHILKVAGDVMLDEIARRKLTLNYELDPEVISVEADHDEIARAMMNIIDNAVRYTPDGGAITISTLCRVDGVRVDVADTGIGMSAAVLSRIFERFFRADEAHTTTGLGLGLTIAQKIILVHGGDLTVESTPGKGTIFRITLPISQIGKSANLAGSSD